MRYLRIFVLHFQDLLSDRGRPFVWFLVTLINPLLQMMFWRGAGRIDSSFTLSFITSYYFLLIIAGAMLMSHIEESISEHDMQKGYLSQYLLKPFSYYWKKFHEELPYRINQGIYGIIVCLVFVLFIGKLTIVQTLEGIIAAFVIAVLAYFISFTFKMLIGLFTLWVDDIQGIYHLIDAVLMIFAGQILPLALMPEQFIAVANILPFAYMIYYPIVALQGALSQAEIVRVISMQCVWLIVLYAGYKVLWAAGVKRFTAYGN